MIYSRIMGTGSYLPENIVTNKDLEKIMDTNDQWIQDRTGIKQRHMAAEGETTVDMVEQAALRAIEASGIDAAEIDMIILGTTTPDLIFPSSACLLQERLGLPGIAAFDLNAACTSFVYSISVADQFIKSGMAKKILVCGAETLSRALDYEDRTTAVLFADGAGAIVLEASEEPGILSTHIHADGRYAHLLGADVGVSRGFKDSNNGGLKILMNGREVFKMAVRTLGQIVDETLAANNLEKSDIDWLIPHQANLRIIMATAKKLNMPMEKVIVTVDKHGNTSAASVALALDEGVRSGRVKRGDTILLEAFGGGFTWGSALIKY
ncbi:MAG: ketoacyl-ACP synthase III [Xanthomonadales bacterium]|nr:ketoacyl-ACP synthase III [Xanthomonadales bacterium]